MKESRAFLPGHIAALFESRGIEITGQLLARTINGSSLRDEVAKGGSITKYAISVLKQLLREREEQKRLDEYFCCRIKSDEQLTEGK